MASYGQIMRSCSQGKSIFVDYLFKTAMIDNNNREPYNAVIAGSFFIFGQIIQWFGDPNNLQYIKDFLSIISFVISIIVGLRSLIKKSKRRKV
jgi:putative Mn2+ efflux pump MntP